LFFLTFVLVACSSNKADKKNDKIHVVVSTTIIADVVVHIAGDNIELHTLLPYGASPHNYNPTPKDVEVLSNADLVLFNGFELEQTLKSIVLSAGVADKLVEISEGVGTRKLGAGNDDVKCESSGHHHHHATNIDPHVWLNPLNVVQWSDNIAYALSEIDPKNKNYYRQNSNVYKDSLSALDDWIFSQVQKIDPARRKLVTDHLVYGYFADRYVFKLLGAAVPAFSSMAEPSAKDLAKLEDVIKEKQIKAIFVGNTANPAIMKRISSDLEVELVPLMTGSLDEEGEGSSYMGYMRYNVNAMVKALK